MSETCDSSYELALSGLHLIMLMTEFVSPSCVDELKVAVINLAVLQVLYDFKIAIEVRCIAVDDRYPKLILSFSVEVGQSDCSNNGIHVARSVADDHLQGWMAIFVEVA